METKTVAEMSLSPKNELTVADFINLSTIYTIVDKCITMYSDELTNEYADEIKQDLQDIYTLITSAVTLSPNSPLFKGGQGGFLTTWYIPISECHFFLTHQKVMNIAGRVEKLNDHFKQHFHHLDDIEKAIADNLSDCEMELALDMLLSSLAQL